MGKVVTQQMFIDRCNRVHNFKYDYSKTVYTKSQCMITIICPTHGEFQQRAASHVDGYGCNRCSIDQAADEKRLSLDNFITRSNLLHNNKYDYSKVVYKNNSTKIIIVCPIHGPFKQVPASHLQSNGCDLCARIQRVETVDMVAKTAKSAHTRLLKYGRSDAFNAPSVKQQIKDNNLKQHGVPHASQNHYGVDTYNNINDRDWLIDQHHIQQKSALGISYEHNVSSTTILSKLHEYDIEIRRYACSSGEQQLHELLTSYNIDYVVSDRTVIRPYELDIVIPEHKIAIEYCGLYWHSDKHKNRPPNYHKNKMDLCLNKGYQLITVFEDEWMNHNQPVVRKILRLCGIKEKQTYYARKTNIISVTPQCKKSFFNEHHIQGNGPGSINYGLSNNNGIVVACMTFIEKENGIFYLNRYATSCNVPGGFSKLLNHFQTNHKYVEIVSFADCRWSDGGLYETNGFILDKTIPPDYSYSKNGNERVHKFNYRHKYLPKLLKNYDPTLSETVNCDNNGILRIWDCGKKRYIKRCN